jgi:tetratricopeptide (TPR) repeat protein
VNPPPARTHAQAASRSPGSAPRSAAARAFAPFATLALVAIVVAAAHWPVLNAGAIAIDDDKFIEYNALVANPGWSSVGRFFSEVTRPSTVPGYYLPLSMTSLMLDWGMGGRPDDLRVFHRTSLALHVLVTLLLVLILQRLFGAWVPAALAGLLFGLHPLTVEPVAWVGERKTLLATFFALGCILSWLQGVGGGRPLWRWAAVALFALALLSKPTVATLPLLLVLLDAWPLRRAGLRALLEKWPFFLLALASGAVTLVSHGRTVGTSAATGAGLLSGLVQAGYVLGFYLAKLVRPFDLTPVYAMPASFAPSNPALWPALAGVAALTLALVLVARRARGPLVGWLVFVLAIAPTLGFVRYSWVTASDKYVYFPLVGLLLVLGAGLADWWHSPRLGGPVGRAALLALALLFLAAEARGVRAALAPWSDSLALRRHIVAVAPQTPAAHLGLGTFLEQHSARAEALRHFRRAVELDPGRADAQLDLGLALERRGLIAEALEHLKVAVRDSPEWVDPCNELAWLLATGPDPALRDPHQALRLADRAVVLSGGHDPNVLDTQAAVQAAAGQFARAVETAGRARDLALSMNAVPLAEALRARLAGYERGLPFTLSPADSLARLP